MLSRRMLSHKDEVSSNDDNEVRKEDQDRINRFSRLHSREKTLQDELKAKEKEKEDLEDISSELELADEDEPVSYKIGDTFFNLPLEEVQQHLSASIEAISEHVTNLQDKLSGLRDEMQELKTALYGRFGRSINLEA